MEWFQGNWVDLVLIVILVLYAYDGYRRGFLALGFELIGFVLAVVGAFTFYAGIGELLIRVFGLARPFAKAVGFLAGWGLIEFLYPYLAVFLFKKVPERHRTSRLNRTLGPLPAFLDGSLLVTLLLSLAVTLPFPAAIKQDLADSKIGGFLLKRAAGLELSIDAAFGGAVKETLAFLTVRQGSTETVDLRFTTDDFRPAPEAEKRMLDLVNAERTKQGLRPLRVDPVIAAVARAHSADMLRRGYFSHVTPEGKTPADRADDAGVRYFVYGENIAYAPDVSIAHSGLMNSPGHRANILSPEFGRIGIGAQDAGIYGMMFTQNFAD